MECFRANGDRFDAPFIVSRKPAIPGDPTSPAVLQYEQPLGVFLGLLPRSAAVEVPRSRFTPVKTLGDLLSVSSDAYRYGDALNLELAPARMNGRPPFVGLDPQWFRSPRDLRERFPEPPALLDAERLVIRGNLGFRGTLRCAGCVEISDMRRDRREMVRLDLPDTLTDVTAIYDERGISLLPNERRAAA